MHRIETAIESFQSELKDILPNYPEPQKTVLRLYHQFLLNHLMRREVIDSYKGRILEGVPATRETAILHNIRKICENFAEVKRRIATFNITLPVAEIESIFKKYGVIQLRLLSRDILIVGCGESHAPHNHSTADTLDPDLTMNPTVVGYHGDIGVTDFFEASRHRYDIILDEGPMTVSDQGSYHALQHILKDKGVVAVKQFIAHHCISIHLDGITDKGVETSNFATHLHLISDKPPGIFLITVEDAKKAISPYGIPYKPHLIKNTQCTSSYLRGIFNKIQEAGFSLQSSATNIFFKDKTDVSPELQCPYSKCTDVFSYEKEVSPARYTQEAVINKLMEVDEFRAFPPGLLPICAAYATDDVETVSVSTSTVRLG